MKRILIFLGFILMFPLSLFSQSGEFQPDRQYDFSEEEIKSGFAFEQLQYLIGNNRYCIHQKVVSNLFLGQYDIEIPDGYLIASIDYQDYLTIFSLAGHKTIIQFFFSNVGGARIDGQYFRARPTNKNVILKELSIWEKENDALFSKP